jgi:hypothetical protein
MSTVLREPSLAALSQALRETVIPFIPKALRIVLQKPEISSNEHGLEEEEEDSGPERMSLFFSPVESTEGYMGSPSALDGTSSGSGGGTVASEVVYELLTVNVLDAIAAFLCSDTATPFSEYATLFTHVPLCASILVIMMRLQSNRGIQRRCLLLVDNCIRCKLDVNVVLRYQSLALHCHYRLFSLANAF